MLEIFLTFSTAYILRRLRVFSPEDAKVLVNYVLYFALPLMSFKIAHSLGLSREVLYVGASAWLVILFSLLCAYLTGRVMRLDSVNLRSLMMASAFGNTAFLGYPYSFAYFGEEGLRYAIVYDNAGSFLAVSSVGLFLVSGRIDIRSLLLFPPFLGLMAGFALRGYSLPIFLQKFIDFSSASLLPVVLFSLGIALDLSYVRKEKKLLLVALLLKMFLSPLFALIFLSLFPMERLSYKVCVLQSAMPTMIMASILTLRYGLNYSLTFASAGVGILLSFLTVPFWVRVIMVVELAEHLVRDKI
ncbi:MAG: AEC family transporter [Aquificaceae bacterium]